MVCQTTITQTPSHFGFTSSNSNVGKCLVARTPEAFEQVYRLRYSCYRRDQSIPVNAQERFTDRFDDCPNSFSFLVHGAENSAAATVRISVVKPEFGWVDSPVCHVYGGHPAFDAIAQESFVESSRLCFGLQARRDAFVNLVGNMAALADFYSTEWLVACPRAEHSRVYQKMFGFVPLAAPRKYFGVAFETQLLAIRREELRAYVGNMKSLTNAWSNALREISASKSFPLPRPTLVS